MTTEEKIKVFERANVFLNSLNHEEEMVSIIDSIKEYKLCYSISWCEKTQLNINPEKRNVYVGAGRVLVSKKNDLVEHAGSAPFVDWVHQFELKVQNLEEYWVLEIVFSKRKISSIKTLLNLNTPDLLKRVNKNSKIILEGEDYELKRMKNLMDKAEIQNEILLKKRTATN